MPFKILVAILVFFSISNADFLSLNIVEKEEPPPNFVYGLSYTGRFFASGVDNFGGLNAHWRLNKNWAIGAKTEMNFSREGFVAGAFGRYLPVGELIKESAENFAYFGVDYITIGYGSSPLFSVGYGRDMLPWKRSPLGFRVLGRLEYAPIKHIFSRENESVFGINMVKLANTGFAVEIGLFHY
ncbi:MAG: hypothetical protein LBU89_00110 [Fibromonadaceae bacterium]|jgi:hypothetical protein|nr:hypothetical protein [Fibromonadaceae bacterium]